MQETKTKKSDGVAQPSSESLVARVYAREFLSSDSACKAADDANVDAVVVEPSSADVASDQAEQTATATDSAASNQHLQGAALKAYGQHTRKAAEDKMILEFLPMVHKIVHQVVSYLRPPLSKEDLVSAGTIGLVKAARDYNPSSEAEFKTYAYIRIRGAVIDELRGWSFTPTNIRKQFNHAQQVLEEMTVATGQTPSDEELAERLGITIEKLYKMFETARTKHFLSIHGVSDEAPALGDSLACTSTDSPGAAMEHAETVEVLSKAIDSLPEKQRRLIVLYYHKELTMKEVAEVLKITESRVSQLHAAALFKLSAKMKRTET